MLKIKTRDKYMNKKLRTTDLVTRHKMQQFTYAQKQRHSLRNFWCTKQYKNTEQKANSNENHFQNNGCKKQRKHVCKSINIVNANPKQTWSALQHRKKIHQRIFNNAKIIVKSREIYVSTNQKHYLIGMASQVGFTGGQK